MARAEWQAILCFFHFSQDSEIQLPVLAAHPTFFRSADILVGLGLTNASKPTRMSALLLPKLPMLEKGGMRTCFGGQNFGTCARPLP
jgi:hypothetical protein